MNIENMHYNEICDEIDAIQAEHPEVGSEFLRAPRDNDPDFLVRYRLLNDALFDMMRCQSFF